MKRSDLLHIITESIKKQLVESYSTTLETVFQEVSIKIDQYKRYADQLESELETVGNICNNIADAVSSTFSVELTPEQFTNCSLDGDELTFNVYIPLQNFLNACKNREDIMQAFQEESGQSEQELIEYGMDSDWDDMYTSDGASISDRYHSVRFRPYRVANNMVECNVSVDNAFVNYD